MNPFQNDAFDRNAFKNDSYSFGKTILELVVGKNNPTNEEVEVSFLHYSKDLLHWVSKLMIRD